MNEPTLRSALYYPYIHIRSEHWLKATLLCAPAVKRIVPAEYEPEDSAIIARYSELTGSQGPLLQTVAASHREALEAQMRLLSQIKDDIRRIRGSFSRQHAPKKDAYWIHDAKFNGMLLSYLLKNRLAWPSVNASGYGNRRWHALHPTFGSAIMTTLGLSIARAEKLDIVTPNRSVHETLLTTDEDAIFEALTAKHRGGRRVLVGQSTRDLGHVVVMLAGVNLQALQAEAIAELHQSPHFLAFQQLVRSAAESIERGEGAACCWT